MEFTKNGVAAKGTYEYKGYQIYDYESGSRGVRYFFEKTDGDDAAPKYVQFSDHGIAPEQQNIFIFMQETIVLMHYLRKWKIGQPITRLR